MNTACDSKATAGWPVFASHFLANNNLTTQASVTYLPTYLHVQSCLSVRKRSLVVASKGMYCMYFLSYKRTFVGLVRGGSSVK